MNDTIKTILSRKSVREFTTKEVEQEKRELLLRAAMAAPTARDTRPWEFIEADDRKLLDTLAGKLSNAWMLKTATLAIVICGDPSRFIQGEREPMWTQDCSAATENILLAAESLGLGAVWTGVFPKKEVTAIVREAFGIPEEIIPFCLIALGYPNGDTPVKDKFNSGRVHTGRW